MGVKKLTKLEVNDFYERKYFISDFGNVYNKEYLGKSLKNKEVLVKAINSGKSIKTTFSPLPSKTKMLELVNVEIDAICKKLDVKKAEFVEEEYIFAGLVFNYFAKNVKYDMRTQEENRLKVDRVVDINDIFILRENKINELKQLGDSKREQIKKLVNKNKKTENKARTLFNTETNYKLLKELYVFFVEKRGVCSEYSYAYSYLLNALDIYSFVATVDGTNAKGNYYRHALNLIQLEDKLYYSDVTVSVVEYEKLIKKEDFENANTVLEDFLMTGEYYNDECIKENNLLIEKINTLTPEMLEGKALAVETVKDENSINIILSNLAKTDDYAEEQEEIKQIIQGKQPIGIEFEK